MANQVDKLIETIAAVMPTEPRIVGSSGSAVYVASDVRYLPPGPPDYDPFWCEAAPLVFSATKSD